MNYSQDIPQTEVFSKEAEQSILGGILLDGDALDVAADIVKPEDFFIVAHADIFRSMLELSRQGKEFDPVIISHELGGEHSLKSVGGARYLGILIDTVPGSMNIKSYAKLVRKKAVLREVNITALEMAAATKIANADPDQIIAEAESYLFRLAESRVENAGPMATADFVGSVLEDIETTCATGVVKGSIQSGFVDIDNNLGGLMPGSMYILAARPSMGKTSLAINVVANAAIRNGVATAVFSLEMTRSQIIKRMAGSEAKIDISKIFRGRLDLEEKGKLYRAIDAISIAPIFIDESSDISASDIRSRARRLKRKQGIEFVVIDYLGLIRGNGKNENRVNEISEISRQLKALAKELNIPNLVLSQLSRAVESRRPPKPMLADLRDSGAIEQDADVVMFIYRQARYKPNDPTVQGVAELLVEKNRNGPCGKIPLTFLDKFARFESAGF
jgi:replicative DNA helicase